MSHDPAAAPPAALSRQEGLASVSRWLERDHRLSAAVAAHLLVALRDGRVDHVVAELRRLATLSRADFTAEEIAAADAWQAPRDGDMLDFVAALLESLDAAFPVAS